MSRRETCRPDRQGGSMAAPMPQWAGLLQGQRRVTPSSGSRVLVGVATLCLELGASSMPLVGDGRCLAWGLRLSCWTLVRRIADALLAPACVKNS